VPEWTFTSLGMIPCGPQTPIKTSTIRISDRFQLDGDANHKEMCHIAAHFEEFLKLDASPYSIS
jgi:hypothetical protein